MAIELIGSPILCIQIEMTLSKITKISNRKRDKMSSNKQRRAFVYDLEDDETFTFLINELKSVTFDKETDRFIGVSFEFFSYEFPHNHKELTQDISYFTVCLDPNKPVNIDKIL